jgi:pyruvate kinase
LYVFYKKKNFFFFKGVLIPNAKINLPAITEKDIVDLKFATTHGVDFVAASFVRTP